MSFTLSQQAYWNRLKVLTQQTGALHKAVRSLAMEIMAEQPNNEALIKQHSQDFEWGNSEILCPVLDALGYQPFIHRKGTGIKPFTPFKQENPTGLVIHIENENNTHWRLHNAKENGWSHDGNCMYHAVAQQIASDCPSLKTNTTTSGPVLTQKLVTEKNYDLAHQVLMQFTTSELIETYNKFGLKDDLNDLFEISDRRAYHTAVRAKLIPLLAQEASRNSTAAEILKASLVSQAPVSCAAEESYSIPAPRLVSPV
ncbi:MAG: hypothetical protein WC756_10595 [Taibaiella sp.]|jgi:hypothetical protein